LARNLLLFPSALDCDFFLSYFFLLSSSGYFSLDSFLIEFPRLASFSLPFFVEPYFSPLSFLFKISSFDGNVFPCVEVLRHRFSPFSTSLPITSRLCFVESHSVLKGSRPWYRSPHFKRSPYLPHTPFPVLLFFL